MDFAGMEKLTLVDFNNHLACILFTRGCNFRCSYCHNSSLVISSRYDSNLIPFSEILDFLKKRQGILDGVVISGGEPTLMSDLKEKLIQIKNLGYLIKLDTNGSNQQKIQELYEAKLIDYVAMDIKNCLEGYSDVIGINYFDLNKIKKSIEYIQNCGIDYEFRTTLIDNFFDEERIEKIGQLLKGSKRLYLQKFVKSEYCINADNLHEVPIEKAKQYQEILKKYVDSVELRGY